MVVGDFNDSFRSTMNSLKIKSVIEGMNTKMQNHEELKNVWKVSKAATVAPLTNTFVLTLPFFQSDVFGICPTDFTFSKDGSKLTIQKSKNLNRCALREEFNFPFPTTTYQAVQSSVSSLFSI